MANEICWRWSNSDNWKPNQTNTDAPCWTPLSPTDVVPCCAIGDTCLGNSTYGHILCQAANPSNGQSNQGLYVAGCTDKSYNSPLCPQQCIKWFHPDVKYNPSSANYACCGGPQSGPPNCSDPTSEHFPYPAPTVIEAAGAETASTATASQTSSSTSSATTSSTSATFVTNRSPTGGAIAGIVVGILIVILFVAVMAYFFIRRRKRSQRQIVTEFAESSTGPAEAREGQEGLMTTYEMDATPKLGANPVRHEMPQTSEVKVPRAELEAPQ